MKRRLAVNHPRLSLYMSCASLINLIQGQLNPISIFQFLNSPERWDYAQQFLYIWPHTFCPRAISHLPHSVISGGLSLQWSDRSPRGGPLRSSQGNLLFNLKAHIPHKCFPHCPLQCVKEILPLVSTIFGILLMLHELCPPICAFQCSHLCDLCRKECCLQRGRNLIQSNPPCDFIMQGTKKLSYFPQMNHYLNIAYFAAAVTSASPVTSQSKIKLEMV